MAKDSDRIGVPFDSNPLVPEDQGEIDVQVSNLSNLQILESFYAERMEMLSRIRQRYLAQNKTLNTQLNFENALLTATSLSLANIALSGCIDSVYVVEGDNFASVDENQSGVSLFSILVKAYGSMTSALLKSGGKTVSPDGYALRLDDPSGKFEIRDGQIALKQGVSLDYEEQSSYQLKLNVNPEDDKYNSSTLNIFVRVNDVAERVDTSLTNTRAAAETNPNKAPTGITLPTNIIQEGVTAFQLGKLVVSDPNPGDKFTFTLQGESTAETLFIRNYAEVDANGVLKLKDTQSLDFTKLVGLALDDLDDPFVLFITATDQGGLSFTKAFDIILNDKPNAVDDSITINEDALFPTLNLTGNDTDRFGQNLKITDLSGFGTKSILNNGQIQYVDPSKGFLSLNPATGILTYGPTQNYNGSFTFTYTVKDAFGGVDTATVTVTVNPINDAPIVPARAITIGEDSGQITGNALTGASDPEGNPFSVRFFTFNGVEYQSNFAINLNPITVAGIGTFNMTGLGAFGFTPAGNFNGIVPISFRTFDTLGAESTSILTITVQSINDNPVAPQVNVSTNEDSATSGDILPGIVKDADGDVVTVAGYTFAGIGRVAGASAFNPNVGTFVLNADGTYTFTPAANFNGTVNVTFAVIDSKGGGDSSGKLTITVNPINDNPALPNITATIAEDNALTGNVIPTGYRDVDGDSVIVGNYRVAGANVGVTNVGNHLVIANVGDLVIQQDGSYTFTPALNFNGPVPTVIVTFADGKGGFDEANLSINVAPVNDPPTNLSVPDNPNVSENVFGALIGSFDFDDPDQGDTFTYHFYKDTPTGPILGGEEDDRFFVQGNQIFLKGDVSLNYETENADGDPTIKVMMTVTDAAGRLIFDTITVTVVDQNDPLIVVNDGVIQDEGTSATVTGNVLDNDFDEDGLFLSNLGFGTNGILIPGFYIDGVTADSYTGALSGLVTGIDFLFPGAGSIQVTSFYKEDSTVIIPNIGKFTMDDDGSYVFTPDNGFIGQVPTIHYGVLSLAPGTATGIEYLLSHTDAPTLNITINATGNQVPTANPDMASGDEDAGNITGNVITNSDTDPNGDTLFVTKFNVFFGSDISVPQGGSVLITIPEADNSKLTIHSSGDYTFEPAPDFFTQQNEPILINYTISDGNGGTSSSTLEITVLPVDDPMITHDDVFSVSVDGDFIGNVITGIGTPDVNTDGIPDGKDGDIDGDTLTVTEFSVRTQIFNPGEVFTQDNGETHLTINAFGDISGVLSAGQSLPPITYTVTNATEEFTTASVAIV